MSVLRLIFRNLQHYWRTGLAAALGIAVATAVMVGSLLVGDSMRGSLRATALVRLGSVDYALSAPHWFSESLAARVNASPALAGSQVVPIAMTSGTAWAAQGPAAVPNVSVQGVDAGFWDLFAGSPPPQLEGRRVAINQSLARDLHVRAGDDILLNVDRQQPMGDDTLFARRKRQDTLRTLRLEVAVVLPDEGAGAFSLAAHSAVPRNVFVGRWWLNTAMGKPLQANTLLVHAGTGATLAAAQTALKDACGLWDYGLAVAHNADGTFYLHSTRLLLSDPQIEAARQAAADLHASAAPTSVYLATTVGKSGAEPHSIAYAMIAGSATPLPMEVLAGQAGQGDRLATVDQGGILLNRWAADDLHAQVGDTLAVTYLIPSGDGSYHEGTASLVARGIVGLSGAAAESAIVPQIDGVTNAVRMDQWDAPFPLDLKRVSQRDEDYWNRYRAIPKAFVSVDLLKSIWQTAAPGNGAGWVTGVRISPMLASWPASQPLPHAIAPPHTPEPAVDGEDFAAALRRHLVPADAQMVFRPVRELVLAFAAGSTDFGMLFVALSMFLVMAAAALAGGLMRLAMERRATQVGVMLACGLNRRTIRGVVLGEGLLTSLLATAAGVPIGILYAAAIIRVLCRWWLSPWGSLRLSIYVQPQSIIGGATAGLLVGAACAAWSLLSLRRRGALQLLTGAQAVELSAGRSDSSAVCAENSGALHRSTGFQPVLSVLTENRTTLREEHQTRAGRGLPAEYRRGPSPCYVVSSLRRYAALILFLIAILLMSLSLAGRAVSPELAFFASGTCLLLAGLWGGYRWLSSAMHSGWPAASLPHLALRNAAANPGRSLLTAGLFAGASFVLVAVAANRRDLNQSSGGGLPPGTGGFCLRAVSTLPLHYDLSSSAGRAHLGFSDQDQAAFANTTVVPLLASQGDDVSCLNLSRPQQPRILGIGEALIRRGGFPLKTWRRPRNGDPWSLLTEPDPQGAIPVFGDADSLQWVLQAGLGEIYAMPHNATGTVKLRIAGVIPESIFAGELLMSQEHFHRLFPQVGAPRYFLLATETANQAHLADVLRSNLGALGLDVQSTRQILNAVIAVQNVCLSMFLAFGGLGVLLGTVGMLAVLLRSIFERRREFAIMLAGGFERRQLLCLVLIENAGLLLAGLLTGTVAALVAVAPALVLRETHVNWPALAALLGGVFLLGALCCAIAVRLSFRRDLIPSLRDQ